MKVVISIKAKHKGNIKTIVNSKGILKDNAMAIINKHIITKVNNVLDPKNTFICS
jgi:hypothetical protein